VSNPVRGTGSTAKETAINVPGGRPAWVQARDAGRPTTSFALVGYPRNRINGGAQRGGDTQCSPVLFHWEYPRERPSSGSGAAYGARQSLRRAESQRAVEGRERSGMEAPHEPGVLLYSAGDRALEPVRKAERFFPRLGGKRRRAEAVPVIQAEEAGCVLRKVGA